MCPSTKEEEDKEKKKEAGKEPPAGLSVKASLIIILNDLKLNPQNCQIKSNHYSNKIK